jgi:hypothetical protein
MIAASQPVQRRPDAKLLVVDARGRIRHASRSTFTEFLHPRDLVIANDAATLPTSLHGVHLPTASPIEVRLAGRRSLDADDVREFSAIVFGPGDFHTRTEDRPAPPPMAPGDQLALGPLSAVVKKLVVSPASGFFTFRRLAGQNLGRSGAPRPPNPIRTRSRTTRPLGRLDSDRRSPSGIRATVGRSRSRLAGADGYAGQRR